MYVSDIVAEPYASGCASTVLYSASYSENGYLMCVLPSPT